MRKMLASACPLFLLLALLAGRAVADEVEIQASPHTINLGSSGASVTIHADVSYYSVADVAATVNGETVTVVYTKPDDCGNLVVKLDITEVKGIIEPPSATIAIAGTRIDGSGFSGSDTIGVVDPDKRERSGK